MNQKDDQDQAFEEYVNGDTALSSHYRATATETPPTALDNAILAAAHREVESKPKIKHTTFLSSWLLPLSMAAVITLCVGLAIFAQYDADFMSKGFDFSVAKNETQSRVVDGTFDQLADELLQIPMKNGITEESEEQSTTSTNKSPFSNATSNDLVAMNELDATSESEVLITGTAYPKTTRAARRPENMAVGAPANTRKSKKSTSRYTAKMVQESGLAEAKLESDDASPLLQSKPLERIQTPQNVRLKSVFNSDQQIERIRKLWIKGDKEDAEKQLKAYLKAKPDYDIEKLKQKLDADFVNRVIKEFKKQ